MPPCISWKVLQCICLRAEFLELLYGLFCQETKVILSLYCVESIAVNVYLRSECLIYLHSESLNEDRHSLIFRSNLIMEGLQNYFIFVGKWNIWAPNLATMKMMDLKHEAKITKLSSIISVVHRCRNRWKQKLKSPDFLMDIRFIIYPIKNQLYKNSRSLIRVCVTYLILFLLY